jgi:hypothetical protein
VIAVEQYTNLDPCLSLSGTCACSDVSESAFAVPMGLRSSSKIPYKVEEVVPTRRTHTHTHTHKHSRHARARLRMDFARVHARMHILFYIMSKARATFSRTVVKLLRFVLRARKVYIPTANASDRILRLHGEASCLLVVCLYVPSVPTFVLALDRWNGFPQVSRFSKPFVTNF